MKRSTILLVLVVAVMGMAIPGTAMAEEVAPNDGPVPGTYPGTEAVPGAPAGTCPAEPTAPQCPPVSEIVILPPVVNGEGVPGYAPVLTPAVTPQSDGSACAVRLTAGPSRDFAQVHMAGENFCLSGVGVGATELSSELWKLQESGSEQFRGADRVHGSGGGTLFAEHNAACDAPHISFRWKALAFGDAIVNGVLYGQTQTNYASLACN